MDDSLFDAYRRTTFFANTPNGRLSLRVGQRCFELDDLLQHYGVTTWGYVTAFNPASVLLSVDENLARQRELERVVAELGFVSYPGEGVGEEGSWPPEPSILILGIGRLPDLGRRRRLRIDLCSHRKAADWLAEITAENTSTS